MMIALIIRPRHQLAFGVSKIQTPNLLFEDKTLPIELTENPQKKQEFDRLIVTSRS